MSSLSLPRFLSLSTNLHIILFDFFIHVTYPHRRKKKKENMEVKEILNHGLTLRQADHLLDKTISFPEIGSTFERIRPITDFRKDDAEARVCK